MNFIEKSYNISYRENEENKRKMYNLYIASVVSKNITE